MPYYRFLFVALAVLFIMGGQSVAAETLGEDNGNEIDEQQANGFLEQHAHGYEAELLEILALVQVGKLESALHLTEQHLLDYPKSRVAYLLKADILLAMSSGDEQVDAQAQSVELEGLRHQLKIRWQHGTEHDVISNAVFPASLIDMGRHKHVLVADLKAGRLYIYENGEDGPSLVRDYYVTVGSEGYGKQVEGDNKTPIGIYSIYRYIDAKELPDLYGDGAFPVNYPNKIDKYRKRTGYGIWLHGTPSDAYARSPFSSEGCFVLSNDDLNDIAQFIDIEEQTPVILSESIEWLDREQLLARQEMYFAILENWRSDWESLNIAAYLSHYSSDNFNLGKADFLAWSEQKRVTNQAKSFIQVDLSIESLFVYPGEQDMFVVNFEQNYDSDNYSGVANKEQYWQRDQNGQWRIIYEG